MLDRLTRRLNIAVARDSVALVSSHGWGRQRGEVLGCRSWDLTDGVGTTPSAALEELLSMDHVDGKAVRVLLGDDLLRFWFVEPPRNATRLSDLEAAAAMRFQTLFDEPMDGWLMSAAIDAAGPFMASAMPRPLLDSLLQVLHQHRMTVKSMEPEFVALWNRWRGQLKAGAWLGVWQGSSLTLGVTQGDALCAMRSVAVPSEALHDPGWLQQQLLRESMRLNLPLPTSLGLCGSPPPSWVSRDAAPVPCQVLGLQGDALSLFGVRA
jgi:hypothetical protein